MKRLFMLVLTGFMMLGLTGCFKTIEIRTVEKTHYVLMSGLESHLQPREYLSPPDAESLDGLSHDQREHVYSDFTLDLYSQVGVCESDKATALRSYYRQLEELQKLNDLEDERVKTLIEKLKKEDL